MPLIVHLQLHPFWHLGGLSLFLLLWLINHRAKSSGIYLAALWNLAGVILHELAHLTAGILLRARPTGFSLIPRRRGREWRLGSVSFSHITPLNAVPIALAPHCLAGIAWLVAYNWFFWLRPTLAATLLLYATLFLLLYNACPSRQDLRIACNWRSLLIYLPLLSLLAWFCYQAR